MSTTIHHLQPAPAVLQRGPFPCDHVLCSHVRSSHPEFKYYKSGVIEVSPDKYPCCCGNTDHVVQLIGECGKSWG